MKLYLVCYDITDQKRLRKIRKIAYGYAFGGQKSAIESYLDAKSLKRLRNKLLSHIDPNSDKINIVEVHPDPILLGKAKRLSFEKGAIVV
jgi:CRISPR-associated protein Cas2